MSEGMRPAGTSTSLADEILEQLRAGPDAELQVQVASGREVAGPVPTRADPGEDVRAACARQASADL